MSRRNDRAEQFGRVAGLVAFAMVAQSEPVTAQSVIKARDFVYVYVISAQPVAVSHSLPLRLPALSEPVHGSLQATAMPKLLAGEPGLFSAEATAQMVIGADDSQGDCQTNKATIRRGNPREQRPETSIALDVCGLLRQSTRFRHAIDVDGLPLASVAKISVFFSRMDPSMIGPPPLPGPGMTSGHVLDDKGQWIAGASWLNRFKISEPKWPAALLAGANRRTPKATRVGVMLKLEVESGVGVVSSCKIVAASNDAQLNAATCNALSVVSYSENLGKAYNSIDAYPVLVQRHGDKVDMTAPALATLPHMPNDVPLTSADLPAGTAQGLRMSQLQIKLDSDGHATLCTVTQSSLNDALDAAGCRIAVERAHFTAPRDWFGRPTLGLYDAVADWGSMTIHPAYQ